MEEIVLYILVKSNGETYVSSSTQKSQGAILYGSLDHAEEEAVMNNKGKVVTFKYLALEE